MSSNIHDINLKPLIICDTNGAIMEYNVACDKLFKISNRNIRLLESIIPGIYEKINKTFREITLSEIKIEHGEFQIWVKSISENRRLIEIINNSELIQLRKKTEFLEKQTKDLQELASLGSLVSQLCHEMNTPLGISVTGLTHIQNITCQTNMKFKGNSLKKSELENFMKNLTDTLEITFSNLARATSILKNLRNISHNQRNLDSSWSQFPTLMDQISKDYNTMLIEKNITLTIVTDCSLQYYLAWGAIYQVISNLIRNSIKHGFTDPSLDNIIKIETFKVDNTSIVIRYSDNGNGIKPQHQHQVFEPYFTTGTVNSSGLGLTIIENILKNQLNGTIELKAATAGATFEIKLEKLKCRPMK